jgi:hypothetical protein
MRVGRIMRDDRLDARGKRLAIWYYVLEQELMSGSQFVLAQPGGQMYAVIGATHEVLRVPTRGGSAWFGYLNETYGLMEHEPWMTAVHDAFRHYIQRRGTKAEMRRFSAYSPQTHTGYVSNYDGCMYKIDGANVSRVTNGEDGIFFADDDEGVPCADPDIGPHGQLLDQLTNPNFAASGLSGITPEQQRKALTLWIFALAFPDLLDDKPILLVEGTMGSGKTSAITHTQLVLTGAKHPMVLQRNKEDDFGVILTRSPIALFDNTDSFIDWVPDAIAAYATGAKWHKRKLFTDDENLVIKPQSFIAVATRNPASFRRDDVADRCMILRFDRRTSFTASGTLTSDLIANRPALFGEYLWFIGQITERIRVEEGLSTRNEQFRMASFAALGRVIGRVLGWSDSDVTEVLQALQGERDAFVNEEDPLVELLEQWIAYKSKHQPSNIGRVINANQLHAELETLAGSKQMQWKDTPRTLVAKLRSTYVERIFRVEIINISGVRNFRLWRHTDAKLELVPDDGDEIISIPE